ncbi:MAG TPA: NifU family protein [Acidimicrobiales bacterium]|nr:NifU family protein [Acidimicrobiales bacterium]
MSEVTTEAEIETPEGAVMSITPEAMAKVIEVRAEEEHSEELALRISVTGIQGIDYSYDLAFLNLEDLDDDDLLWEVDGLTVVVPEESQSRLVGATLDIPSNSAQGGLVIRNPNRPNPLGDIEHLELSGDVPERVQQLLEQRINPALASHGGFATLMGVDDSKAYITMGGGCQGCAMSQATLTEGIQAAILEAIPEITEVIDSTDHASGSNPFYS